MKALSGILVSTTFRPTQSSAFIRGPKEKKRGNLIQEKDNVTEKVLHRCPK